jgi:hypothetical protein
MMPTFSGMNRTLSLVRKFCQATSYFALLALASAVLVSCAGNTGKKTTADVTSSDTRAADTEAETEAIPQNLPDVELTPDLMYKLMLSDLAIQRNSNELALAALVDAAIETMPTKPWATSWSLINSRSRLWSIIARHWH